MYDLYQWLVKISVIWSTNKNYNLIVVTNIWFYIYVSKHNFWSNIITTTMTMCAFYKTMSTINGNKKNLYLLAHKNNLLQSGSKYNWIDMVKLATISSTGL